MRVISGEFRGRRLKSLAGENTRPTTDKVKESMFNVIGPYFDGGACLDLFAGSGALGIEAVSRGMEKAVLVERSFQAMKVIRENVALTKAEQRFACIKKEANAALAEFAISGATFSVIFLDPPYAQQEIEQQLLKMQELQLLEENAVVVAETAEEVELPEVIGELVQFQRKVSGATRVFFYRLVSG